MFQRGLLNHPALAQAAAASFQQLLGAIAAIEGKPASPAGAREQSLAALGSWALVHGMATLHIQGLLPGGASADAVGITEHVLRAMNELGRAQTASAPRAKGRKKAGEG